MPTNVLLLNKIKTKQANHSKQNNESADMKTLRSHSTVPATQYLPVSLRQRNAIRLAIEGGGASAVHQETTI